MKKLVKIYFTITKDKNGTCECYLRTAKECLESAKIIEDKYSKRTLRIEVLRIIFFLIGHSLELSFKAFLLYNDFTADNKLKLKDKIGHNLENLYYLVKSTGLDILNDKERKRIVRLNKYYKDKEFLYAEEKITIDEPYYYYEIAERLNVEIANIVKGNKIYKEK